MKNVMVRAWEIAKEAAAKFGGKVKDYFAQALILAWKEIKQPEDFGFTVIKKLNGSLYFAINNIDGMQVYLLSQEMNLHTRKQYVKRTDLGSYKTAVEKATQRKVRIYDISLGNMAIEVVANGTSRIMNIYGGKLEWKN
ncbi:hypothetical protein [Paenibacillus sp. GbtcB18]|uniref:hypothetical protein n=1 Tax=Paenibacillus sp. GbtcB18 TaxID=2824763 RepID=UPI001C2FF32A|nr:hypothetical protein [Paenibacillus sp. GbtcB18]